MSPVMMMKLSRAGNEIAEAWACCSPPTLLGGLFVSRSFYLLGYFLLLGHRPPCRTLLQFLALSFAFLNYMCKRYCISMVMLWKWGYP
jgi:hypothetical protein